jgi:hypothetical protein
MAGATTVEQEGGDAAQASNPATTTPGGAPAQAATPAIVSLPQEEFDRLVGQRVAEAKRAATKGFLSDLGVNSADEAKTLIAAQKAADDANRTEVERAIARANEEKVAAERERASIATERHSLNVERALMAAGAQGDPAKVARLLEVEVGADQAGIQAAIDAAKTDFPSLFGAATATPAPSEPTGGGAPSRPSSSPDALTRGAERAKRHEAAGKYSYP